MRPDETESKAEAAAWDEARQYRDEHERLRSATEHLARASAEVVRAAALVGDHSSAVPLRAALDDLQLLQAQLATASEKAFTLGQLAVRRAQHASIQRRAHDALTSGPEPGQS
jgi:hypothetical protein